MGCAANIQTELADAFETGGMDAFADKAKFFREEVAAQFFEMFQKIGASPGRGRRPGPGTARGPRAATGAGRDRRSS